MNVNVATDGSRKEEIARAPFQVERLGARLGAEIGGIDLRQAMDPATFEAFEAALIEHKVIVVRDQQLTTAEHVALSRRFGELEVHPMRPQGEFPEILVLDNHKDNPVLSTDVWHSDTTFRRNPTKYTILRCQIMPKVGGDTLWADMEAAFRLRWTPDTIVFWDNRSTKHYAANDYYPERRRMERTAVVGDVPV